VKNSVVARTGQLWKLGLSVLLVLVGSFAPLFAGSGVSWTGGTILVLVGYAFGCLVIRCPACGNRWFWSAALDATHYKPLLSGSACPVCKHDFAGDGSGS
jgi:hypothetical protein